jgi:hypothetical protein
MTKERLAEIESKLKLYDYYAKNLGVPELLTYVKELEAKVQTLRTSRDEAKYSAECERKDAIEAVMDLFFALRQIGGRPTLRDLTKLAKRIKRG